MDYRDKQNQKSGTQADQDKLNKNKQANDMNQANRTNKGAQQGNQQGKQQQQQPQGGSQSTNRGPGR